MVRLWWCVATADSGAADTARWLCGGGVKRMSTAGTPRGGSVVAVGDGLVAWRGCRRLCRGGGGGTRLVEMEVMVASNEDDSEGSGGGVVMMGVCRLPWKRMKIFVSSGSSSGQFLKELRENTFSGSDNEDANKHIEKVLKIVDLFHVPNITVDQLMLRIFSISLTGAAIRWLRNEPISSIKTWEDLKTKFLNKYCPPSRTAKKIEEINNFQQEPDETFYQAWERFKEILMKCPQHYLTEMQKSAADAKTTIQEMAEYSQKWHNGTSRGRSIETSNGLAAIQAQLNNLGREIKKVNEKVYVAQVGWEQCKGPYYTKDCPQKEEVKPQKKLTTCNLVDLFKEGI
ncbi:hypothetical protein Tco_1081424 [Tanacetum coccineum]|uniref:Retrotransposon gag domain-containing protein n=1 Tax=Tanacetum coccineum TaxID=301880 RepID=A0ABQ5HYU5_9ASTR